MNGITWTLAVGLGLLYLFSIGVLIRRQELKALKHGLLTSAFVGGLIALSLFLTRGWDLEVVVLNLPWLSLIAFIALGFLSLWITLRGYFPKLIVRNLEIGAVIVKLLFLCFIPLILMLAKGDPLRGIGLEFSHWGRELGVGLVLGVPLLLLGLLKGEGKALRGAPLSKIIPALGIAFGFHIFQTAIPEEFFFRTFLQGHLASLGSDAVAIVLSSLVFGLGHIVFYLGGPKSYRLSSHKISFLSALASATLNEVSVGLLLGVLWARTGSLIPIVLLHALANTLPASGNVLQHILRCDNSNES